MASIFSNITILNKLPRTKEVGGILIDGLLEEVHNRTANVTKFPVEDGSIISDHITNDPISVTIKGTITNTPLLYTTLQSIYTTGNIFGDRVTEAFEAIEALIDAKKEVSVSTILKVYSNMVIESFTPVKDQTTGQSMSFTMTLTQVTKVVTNTTLISNETIGGDDEDQLIAQSEISQGQTTGTSVTDSDTILERAVEILEERQ